MHDRNQIRTSFRAPLLAAFPPGVLIGGDVGGSPATVDSPTYLWEDRNEVLIAGKVYVEEKLIPVQEVRSANDVDEWTGIYQLLVIVQAGIGTEIPDAWVKRIGDLYPAASSVGVNDVANKTGAAIIRTERGAPFAYNPSGGAGSGSWKAHPISITHKAFAFTS